MAAALLLFLLMAGAPSRSGGRAGWVDVFGTVWRWVLPEAREREPARERRPVAFDAEAEEAGGTGELLVRRGAATCSAAGSPGLDTTVDAPSVPLVALIEARVLDREGGRAGRGGGGGGRLRVRRD